MKDTVNTLKKSSINRVRWFIMSLQKIIQYNMVGYKQSGYNSVPVHTASATRPQMLPAQEWTYPTLLPLPLTAWRMVVHLNAHSVQQPLSHQHEGLLFHHLTMSSTDGYSSWRYIGYLCFSICRKCGKASNARYPVSPETPLLMLVISHFHCLYSLCIVSLPNWEYCQLISLFFVCCIFYCCWPLLLLLFLYL